MNKITQSLKVQLITLFMLCVNLSAFAEVVEINGVFYDLQTWWSYGYTDANGNWQSSQSYERAAIVTYDHSLDPWSVNNRETYQGDIAIPDKVTTKDGVEYPVVAIGDYAFMRNRSLTSVQLPSSVVYIGYYAFYGCSMLTSVTMPGIECFDNSDDIFYGTKLTSLALPKTLKSIRSSMLRYLGDLTSITIEEGNEFYKSVDGVLYDKNMTKIVGFPAKKGGTYTIPATISTVTTSSFPNNVSIDELIVPATVTKIENGAFGDYPQIKKLTIEDSNSELTLGTGNNSTSFYDGNGNSFDIYPMFYNTLNELYWGRPLKFSSPSSSPFAQSNLNKVTFGSEVTSIPKFTFYNCYGITTVDVKGGICQWLNFDFSSNYTDPLNGKTDVTVTFDGSELSGTVAVPDEITTIPAHGFQYGCSKVTSLSIHAGVTTIADGAFKGLSSLNTIQLAAGNTNYVVEDNVLYNNEKTKMLCFPQLRTGDYTMPATITEMGNYQFYNCVNLTGVTLPNTIKTIPQYAFANCSKLATITIPASVEKIDDSAFDGCTALASIVIEDATTPLQLGKGKKETKYDTWTDYQTVGLFAASPVKELYIGRNLEFLDNNYKGYTESWNPNNLIYNYSTFNSSLQVLTIGNKVTKLPGGLFYNCNNIRDVNFDGTIIEWCNITFADQYATPFGTLVSLDPYGEAKSSTILYLKEGPLHSQVNIPEGATKIGAYAFYGQRGVTTVIVPSTVTTIEPYALEGATDVYINATNIIDLENINSFGSITNIYVPDEVATNYKQAPVWADIKDRIYPKGFLQVKVDLIAMTESPALLPALNALERVNGEYRISALTNLKICGTINGWDILMIRTKMPNLRHLDLQEATILDNDGGKEYYEGYHTTANTISAYSFYNLGNLRSVILPQNITSIDYGAFKDCRNLKEVKYMPTTCTSIGAYAFENSGLTSIEISESVKTIGYGAFAYCGNLSDVKLCKGLEAIESEAFSGCGIRKLILPTTLKRIESGVFRSCNSLTEIDFAEGLTEIGYEAFAYCSSLMNLRLPNSLTKIEGSAFNGCNNLSVVHVPSMLESIGDYAFTNCGLNAVYAYTVTPIKINQNTFNYNGVDLYAPDNSFYAYYLDTQWSQFQDVKEFEAEYEKWYTARNTDIYIDTDKPIRGDEATGYMYPGSGLIIRGNGEQLVKKLILEWNHGANYPSLIEDGNLNVDELAFIMNVYPYRWYFFCFPCDLKIQDLKFGGQGKYVWRYYDEEARGRGESGWKNFTGDVLKAGVGYIFQCNVEGDIELPAYNPEYLSQTGDKEVNLISQEAANPQDASWNFVGNPNLSYYSLDDMAEDFTSPITVWNDENQTYDAVVPGDDDYEIHPFQAFFVQKPAESEGVTFRAENRATFNQSTERAAARRLARGTRAVNENHLIVNLEISNGSTIDKTRVVFDDSKSLNYEIGSDANKLMSMEAVPQIYTLDNKNVKYAVNTRPNNNNEVRLGFVAPVEGTYTINASLMDLRMALKDNITGTIHDFSKGAYTFLADAGTNDNRFTLVRNWNMTGISEAGIEGLDIAMEDGGIRVNGITDQPVSVYNVKGIRMATLSTSGNLNLASGTYIVCAGDKTSKIIVK